MKNRLVKVLAMVLVVGSVLTACGGEETKTGGADTNGATTDTITNNEINSEIPEQVEGDADSEEVIMTTMEEVENYRDSKLAAYRAAFDNNQIPYDMTANECVMYQLDGAYQIFDTNYEYEQVAYSLYDYHQQEIESGISFEYDFHPEKGLSVDDPYVKMLYELIQTTGEEALLEKITSCEALVTEIQGLEPGVWLCSTDKCKLMVEKKSAGVHCLQFAHVERVYTNVVVEPVYREFTTYAEYETFCNDINAFNLVENVIANPSYKIWESDENYVSLAYETENGWVEFMCCNMGHDGRIVYGVENNFARVVGLGLYDDSEASIAAYEECARKILEYVGDENVDIDKIIEEQITAYQLNQLKLDTTSSRCLAADWFQISIGGSNEGQYPYAPTHCIPIKVEGLLNK